MALLTNRYPGIANEYDKVIKFSQEDKTRARHLELLEKDREYLSAVKTLKARPIYNMQIRRQEQTITDKEDLTQVLRDGTRVVRNNLFHAGKDPGNARDKDLVEASHKVVSRLIEPDLIGGT